MIRAYSPWKLTTLALTHTPERVGFFGRETGCSRREACESILENQGSESRLPR